MTDPVTNTLVLQTEFSDDEMKKAVDEHIKKLAHDVAYKVMLDALNNPDNFRRLLVNNQYEFEVGVMRAMKSYLNNPKNIY